ncbi:TPM domain-containing protein [Candidatus Thorarchaeota archaeon]|nr:MAG: TPM domain-containing protein [Candidatus Thorarchaeota archaeon]
MTILKARPKQMRTILGVFLIGIVMFSITLNAQAIPTQTGYMVNDWAHILTFEEEEDLEYSCRYIEEQTTVEVFIITTDDLEGEDLNRYSYLLFNGWGMGKDDVNNGLLLILYYWENETHYYYNFRVEIGRGLEGAITASEAARITNDNITFWFDWAYFYDGFYEGLVEFYDEFKDDPSVRSQISDPVGLAAFRLWGYENPLIAGAIVAVGLTTMFYLLQFSLYRRRMVLFPLIGMGVLVLFAWWWDGSLLVLGYAIAIAIGATITIKGGNRVRPGGGRTEGGGYTY